MKREPIIELSKQPEWLVPSAQWFHKKWKVPLAAYLESMEESRKTETGVPAWYILPDEGGNIAAGIGVIANDFHKRPDLTPNLCALYVEEAYRHQGVARRLLDHACEQLAAHGAETAYLITSHTEFYEQCGWQFYGMIVCKSSKSRMGIWSF